MTTELQMQEWLQANGYVKKIDNLKLILYFGLGFLFLLVFTYGVETDGFKSTFALNNTVNNTINPQTNIANAYSFNPNTTNGYNYTIVNNITIVNKMNCS